MSVNRNYGASYEQFSNQFTTLSHPVDPPQQNSIIIYTILLVLLAFGSLSTTLLGDIKNKSFLAYFLNSLVASSKRDEYSNDPNVFELTATNFNKIIHHTNYTTVVKFYAPWCGYCQQLKPVWTKLANHFAKDSQLAINVASLNCDKYENKQLCSQYRIQGFPTLMVFRPPKFGEDGNWKKSKRHASEVYTGPRNLKSISQFATSRIKNYVKKLHNMDNDFKDWVSQNSDTPKVLLINKSNSVSPLLKTLAIDYLSRVDFAMLGKHNDEAKVVSLDGKEVEIPITEKSTLFYYDGESGKLIAYDESKKLDDKLNLSKWISKVTGVEPVEGPLSKKGRKLEKYRTGKKKVEHDEL
ncbi:hypothetical protein KGF56_003596 [Candida oxycetoniae]|uniref:Thioredoxin domain-containing protein n=1 Tax=Candida oxycetoniae TaxID=497107 RepID=A0AAI9WWS4_9ASCO|nr:uncharacterized protein KGF56_003596 [Candida oxycetoniae]KAI3403551.2 hypothetical protein KGF56_003596 [Candida oxycetoniae]